MSAGAVLVAAGRSQRMQGVDKTIVPLLERPLAAWTIEAFDACAAIDCIVLVSGERNQAELERLGAERAAGKLAAVVPGGARRQDSVARGLAALPAEVEIVAVHDVARPLVTPSTIARGVELARERGAAIATAAVSDTIKQVDAAGAVRATIDRDALRAVQTPQVFRRDLLERAHAASRGDVTDDAMLVEALGAAVLTYPSDAPNLKITTPDDLIVAAALLRARLGTSEVDR